MVCHIMTHRSRSSSLIRFCHSNYKIKLRISILICYSWAQSTSAPFELCKLPSRRSPFGGVCKQSVYQNGNSCALPISPLHRLRVRRARKHNQESSFLLLERRKDTQRAAHSHTPPLEKERQTDRQPPRKLGWQRRVSRSSAPVWAERVLSLPLAPLNFIKKMPAGNGCGSLVWGVTIAILF